MDSWKASQRREMCAPRRAVAQGGKTVEPKWQRRIPERAIGPRELAEPGFMNSPMLRCRPDRVGGEKNLDRKCAGSDFFAGEEIIAICLGDFKAGERGVSLPGESDRIMAEALRAATTCWISTADEPLRILPPAEANAMEEKHGGRLRGQGR